MIYTRNLGDIWNTSTVCKWLLPICPSEFYVLFKVATAFFFCCMQCLKRKWTVIFVITGYMVVSGTLQIIVMLLEWQPKAFTSFGDHVKEHMEPVKKYIENTWNMWRNTLKNHMEHVKKYIKKLHGTCKGRSTCHRYLQSCTCLLCRSWNV